MADAQTQTEEIGVRVPSGETVTVRIPVGLSDADVKSRLQKSNPEYFQKPAQPQVDTSKGFFAPGNEGAKDPFAFSQQYVATHPAQPQSTWQKIKNYASAATKPWEGSMAPRNAEEALSGVEMLAGEMGGALLGPAGKSAASSGVKSAIAAAEPKPIPAAEAATVPSIVRRPGEILPERVGAPSAARIPAIAQRSGESVLPGGGVIKRPPLALLPETTEKPQIPMANAAPFQLTSPPTASEAPVQMSLNLQTPPKPSIKTLGNLIEQSAGTPPMQANVPLREQIPPRTAVIPRAPLGSRVAVPVGEEFGPLIKKMGEIPRAITEEPARQMGAPPMRPGVSLREQPKTAEAPIRSEQARLEEKYSDKAIRQMVHANGEEMVDAIGNDPDTMRAVHNLTNPDVRQAMINSGEDMGQMGINNRKLEGSGSMSRQAALKKLLSKGFSPQEIVKMAKEIPSAKAELPTFTAEKYGPGNTRQVSMNAGGQQQGYLMYDIDPSGKATVSSSLIADPSMEGLGHGTRMYEKAIEDARAAGAKEFTSGSTPEPGARRVWESLARKYPIQKTGNGYTINLR